MQRIDYYVLYYGDEHLTLLLRGYEEHDCRLIDGETYIHLSKMVCK